MNSFVLSGQFEFFGAGVSRLPNMKDPYNDTGLLQILAAFGFEQIPQTRAFAFGKTWLETLLQPTNRS